MIITKNIISIIIKFACVITLAGCGGDASSNSLASEPSTDMPVTSEKAGGAPPNENETTEAPDSGKSSSSLAAESSAFVEAAQNSSSAVADDLPLVEPSMQTGVDAMPVANIQVGSASFTIMLYDNASTRALLAAMPLTINMDDLNGNEKYHYLTDSLPTDSQSVGSINTGDLMLYGSDCLVLFYKRFSTSYSYTRLGYIEDASGLAEALGSGNVQVTFTVPKVYANHIKERRRHYGTQGSSLLQGWGKQSPIR